MWGSLHYYILLFVFDTQTHQLLYEEAVFNQAVIQHDAGKIQKKKPLSYIDYSTVIFFPPAYPSLGRC